MRVLSATFFALVLLAIGNNGADGFVDKMAKGANDIAKKVGDGVKKFSDTAISEGISQMCDHGCGSAEVVLKGFGVAGCDAEGEHKAEKWCKDCGNFKSICDLMCCIGNEKRGEVVTVMVNCFQEKDHHKQDDCVQEWYKWVMQFPEAIEMMKGAGK